MTEAMIRKKAGMASVKDMPLLQDGPPPGGFAPVRFARRIPSKGPSAMAIFLATFGTFSWGMYQVGKGNKIRSILLFDWRSSLACFGDQISPSCEIERGLDGVSFLTCEKAPGTWHYPLIQLDEILNSSSLGGSHSRNFRVLGRKKRTDCRREDLGTKDVLCEKLMIRKRYVYLTEEISKEICAYMAPSLDARHDIVVVEVPKLGKEAAQKAIKEWGSQSLRPLT